MNKKFLALGILASLLVFGCSDDTKKKDKPGTTAICNNGVLEGNEICDGSEFAAGKRVCPDGYTVSDETLITCTDVCELNLAACALVNTANCNNDHLDEGEECDGEDFDTAKRVCPSGSSVDDVNKLTCKDNCTIDKSACVVEGSKCQEDAVRCDGSKWGVCVDGQWLEEDCSPAGKVCSEADGCIFDYKGSCNNNVLHFCDGDDCIDQDCTELHAICDATTADCIPTDFTCDGTVLKLPTPSSVTIVRATKPNRVRLPMMFCAIPYGVVQISHAKAIRLNFVMQQNVSQRIVALDCAQIS